MIARQDIPYSVEGFSDAIEQIFGLGARHLKILFMKNLHAKVEVTCGPLIDGPVKVDCSRDDVSRACRLIRQNFEAANDDKVEMGVLVNEYEELQK